jgi:hypothetical protein
MEKRFDIYVATKTDGYLILTVPTGEMPADVKGPDRFRKIASAVQPNIGHGGWIDWPAALQAISRQGYSLQGLAVAFIEGEYK